jgi:hypothetical protein
MLQTQVVTMNFFGNYYWIGAKLSTRFLLTFTWVMSTAIMGGTAFTSPGIIATRTSCNCNHGMFAMHSHSVVQDSTSTVASFAEENNFGDVLQLPHDRLPTVTVGAALEHKNFFMEEKEEETNLNEVLWGKLIPDKQEQRKPWWAARDGGVSTSSKPKNNLDVTTVWHSPVEGAEEMLEKIMDLKVPLSPLEHLRAKDQLTDSFSIFKKLYEKQGGGNTNDNASAQPVTYKSRIVATRGTPGTKCPRYHSDSVPLRLICALKGPGVVFVDDERVNVNVNNSNLLSWRDTINQSDEVDSLKFNKGVEAQLPAQAIRHAKCGANVLLLGKAWENGEKGIQGAVHRSPFMDEDEGRVLLTVDVVVDY